MNYTSNAIKWIDKLKYVIISQVGNKEERVYDWIKYHCAFGFDTFIIFDDYSLDKTRDEIKRASEDFENVNFILKLTDDEGNFYDIETCANSNDYGNDPTLDARLNRSYTRGNNIVKSINPDAICCLLDQDEFIFSNIENINIISEIFEKQKCVQLLIQNFDVLDNYELEKGFLFNNNFIRWDYDDTSNHPVWNRRVKPFFISKYLDVSNFVHQPISNPKTYYCDDYEALRMLHFRKPNLQADNIKFVEDKEFSNYLNKIKLKLC